MQEVFSNPNEINLLLINVFRKHKNLIIYLKLTVIVTFLISSENVWGVFRAKPSF